MQGAPQRQAHRLTATPALGFRPLGNVPGLCGLQPAYQLLQTLQDTVVSRGPVPPGSSWFLRDGQQAHQQQPDEEV